MAWALADLGCRQRRHLMEYEKVWDKMKKEMGLDPVLDWKQL